MDLDHFIERNIIEFLTQEAETRIQIREDRAADTDIFDTDKDYVREIQEALAKHDVQKAKRTFTQLKATYNRIPPFDPRKKKLWAIVREAFFAMQDYVNKHGQLNLKDEIAALEHVDFEQEMPEKITLASSVFAHETQNLLREPPSDIPLPPAHLAKPAPPPPPPDSVTVAAPVIPTSLSHEFMQRMAEEISREVPLDETTEASKVMTGGPRRIPQHPFEDIPTRAPLGSPMPGQGWPGYPPYNGRPTQPFPYPAYGPQTPYPPPYGQPPYPYPPLPPAQPAQPASAAPQAMPPPTAAPVPTPPPLPSAPAVPAPAPIPAPLQQPAPVPVAVPTPSSLPPPPSPAAAPLPPPPAPIIVVASQPAAAAPSLAAAQAAAPPPAAPSAPVIVAVASAQGSPAEPSAPAPPTPPAPVAIAQAPPAKPSLEIELLTEVHKDIRETKRQLRTLLEASDAAGAARQLDALRGIRARSPETLQRELDEDLAFLEPQIRALPPPSPALDVAPLIQAKAEILEALSAGDQASAQEHLSDLQARLAALPSSAEKTLWGQEAQLLSRQAAQAAERRRRRAARAATMTALNDATQILHEELATSAQIIRDHLARDRYSDALEEFRAAKLVFRAFPHPAAKEQHRDTLHTLYSELLAHLRTQKRAARQQALLQEAKRALLDEIAETKKYLLSRVEARDLVHARLDYGVLRRLIAEFPPGAEADDLKRDLHALKLGILRQSQSESRLRTLAAGLVGEELHGVEADIAKHLGLNQVSEAMRAFRDLRLLVRELPPRRRRDLAPELRELHIKILEASKASDLTYLKDLLAGEISTLEASVDAELEAGRLREAMADYHALVMLFREFPHSPERTALYQALSGLFSRITGSAKRLRLIPDLAFSLDEEIRELAAHLAERLRGRRLLEAAQDYHHLRELFLEYPPGPRKMALRDALLGLFAQIKALKDDLAGHVEPPMLFATEAPLEEPPAPSQAAAARATLEELRQRLLSDSPPAAAPDVSALYALGVRKLYNRQPGEAAAIFRQLLSINPGHKAAGIRLQEAQP